MATSRPECSRRQIINKIRKRIRGPEEHEDRKRNEYSYGVGASFFGSRNSTPIFHVAHLLASLP